MNTRESNNYNRGIMQIPTISYQLSPSSKFKKPLYTCEEASNNNNNNQINVIH